jgi:hypothetical protein
MNTSEITSFVKKYYLDGQCESAIWNQSPTGYKVNFFTATKDCLGEIEFNTEIEDGETKFGVFSTSQLLSLMTITDEFYTLSLERDPKGNPMKLQISDNQFETFYHLADLNLFENAPSIEEPQNYNITIDIDQEFTSRFVKAKNALDKSINRITIETKQNPERENCVELVIGESSSHANKIKFFTPAKYDIQIEAIPFNGDILKLIFQSNKDFDSGKIEIFSEGLAKITFIKGNIKSKYFLVRLATS